MKWRVINYETGAERDFDDVNQAGNYFDTLKSASLVEVIKRADGTEIIKYMETK